MPTAPKLISAAFLGALAFYLSGLVIPLLPEGTQIGYFQPVSVAIGLVTGWVFLGPRAEDTWSAAIGFGITSAAVLMFWALLLFALTEMTYRSIDMRYRGPIEALLGMFDLMKDYALLVAVPDFLISLFVGGVIAGLLNEWVSRR